MTMSFIVFMVEKRGREGKCCFVVNGFIEAWKLKLLEICPLK